MSILRAASDNGPDLHKLRVVRVNSLGKYRQHQEQNVDVYRTRWLQERHLASGQIPFQTDGYCYVCQQDVLFETDFLYGSAMADGVQVPNWRERVLCPCGLNNRIRASVQILEQILGADTRAAIYIAEQVTPLYKTLAKRFPLLVGSEYLGEQIALGSVDANGVRNESITKLTFSDNAFDYVLNFDVLEHIPEPMLGLKEIFRVLKPGGRLVLSVPFLQEQQNTRVRARLLEDGSVEHLAEPQYHGDPVSASGCLCFQDFGWDLLDRMRDLGFKEVSLLLYWSDKLGYYGVEQSLIVAQKPITLVQRFARAMRSYRAKLKFQPTTYGAHAALASRRARADRLETFSNRTRAMVRRVLDKLRLLTFARRMLGRNAQGQPNASSARAHDATNGQSTYAGRLAAEHKRFTADVNVHDLPPIYHYWSNKYLRPSYAPFGFSDPDSFYCLYLEAQINTALAAGHPARFVSIGAGNCDTEIRLALILMQRGYQNFVIHCFDMNDVMLKRGYLLATEAGVGDQIATTTIDFNFWQPTTTYDAVIANQSLHHIEKLEALFANIKRVISTDGVFLTSDIVGRNGHMRWPEALQVVQEFWRELPPDYRYNLQLDRYEESFQNWDCSHTGFEGVRAQDILPLLIEQFHFESFFTFANVIDPFIDRGFGHHFNVDSAIDRALIDRIQARDDAEMRAGRIKPTHILAAMRAVPIPLKAFIPPFTPAFCVRDAVAASLPGDEATS